MDAIAVGRAEVHWSTSSPSYRSHIKLHIKDVYLHNRFVIIRWTNKRDQNEHENWNNKKRRYIAHETEKNTHTNTHEAIFFTICIIIIMWRTGATMNFDHNNKNLYKRDESNKKKVEKNVKQRLNYNSKSHRMENFATFSTESVLHFYWSQWKAMASTIKKGKNRSAYKIECKLFLCIFVYISHICLWRQ